jgi:hypothetical protein
LDTGICLQVHQYFAVQQFACTVAVKNCRDSMSQMRFQVSDFGAPQVWGNDLRASAFPITA